MKKGLFTLVILLMLVVPCFAGLKIGLVACYLFNGNANDESGNNYDGIVQDAILTQDRFGNLNCAYDFDGINKKSILLPSELKDSINNYNGITVAAWVYNRGPGENYRTILRIFDGNPYRGLMFRIGASSVEDVNSNKFEVLLGTTYSQTQHIASSTDIPTNRWTHLAMSYDGYKIWIYIDGEAPENVYRNGMLVSNGVVQTGTITMGNDGAAIGARVRTSGNTTNKFNGYIDDVRIYNRSLSVSEIKELGYVYEDSDNDGVPDNVDQCPGTIANSYVDQKGCARKPSIDSIVKDLQIVSGIR